jgi:hypothetical protein
MPNHFLSGGLFCSSWPYMAQHDDTFEAFQQSITVLGKPFMPFLLIIQTLAPQLLPWFRAVDHDAAKFSIPACPWQDLAAFGFQDHIMGSLLVPVTIIDTHAFSLLQDMRHGLELGWRLNYCDGVLSPGRAVDRR